MPQGNHYDVIIIGQFAFVPSGQVSSPEGELGFQRGLLVRDLDGYVMQVVEQ